MKPDLKQWSMCVSWEVIVYRKKDIFDL